MYECCLYLWCVKTGAIGSQRLLLLLFSALPPAATAGVLATVGQVFVPDHGIGLARLHRCFPCPWQLPSFVWHRVGLHPRLSLRVCHGQSCQPCIHIVHVCLCLPAHSLHVKTFAYSVQLLCMRLPLCSMCLSTGVFMGTRVCTVWGGVYLLVGMCVVLYMDLCFICVYLCVRRDGLRKWWADLKL